AGRVVGACETRTRLVSVGLANGEVGSLAPVAAITAGLRGRGLLVHSDAAQAAGRIPLDVAALGVDLLSLSAHKLGGPAGIGALWVRRGVELAAQTTGGPQERGWRAGTESVAAAVGFGVAVAQARGEAAGEEAVRVLMAAAASDPGAASGVLAPPPCGVPSGTPRRSSLRLPLSLPGSFASLTMITRTDSYGVQRSVTRGVTGPRASATRARSVTRPFTGTMTGTVAVHAAASAVGRGSAPIASASAWWLAAAVGSRRLARGARRRARRTVPVWERGRPLR